MKLTKPVIFFTTIASTLFFATPSMASECTGSMPAFTFKNEVISVKSRIRKSNGYQHIDSDSATFGCTITSKMAINYVIPDDSNISSVDLYLYVNGRQLRTTQMSRGSSITLKFSPDKVQDFKIEFKNFQTPRIITGGYYIYSLDLSDDPSIDRWINTP
jgi:hypothetical protein